MSADAAAPAAAGSTRADRLTDAVPVVVAFLWLCVLYGWQTRGHVTPWLFTDELKYTQIARSIAETGQASERHHSVAFDTLYTYAIAPFWRIHDVHTAYSAIKYFGVIVMTAAIFPTYLLARMVVSRPWALFAAAGAVAGPSLAYGSFMIEEPLAYPVCALSFFLIAKGLVTRSWWWNVAASVSVLLAMFVRGQLAILIVVYVVAALFLAWTSEPVTRWRAGWSAWDWVGFVVLAIGAVIVFSASVGAFSQTWIVATGYYRHRMIVYGLWAGGAFSIGVGLLPVVALAALVRPKGVRWTRELRAFVAVAAASVLVFGFYTAVKAAYLSTVFSTVVEERNLIYLAPIVFVCAGLALERRRLNLWAAAASAGFVLYVILTTPFQLNLYPYADALGLGIVQMANRRLSFDDGEVKILLSVALAISLVLLLAPGLRRVARVRWAGLGLTLVAAALVISWNVAGEVSASNGVNLFSRNLLRNFPTPPTWIDDATGGKPTIYLGQKITDPQGIWLMEFWNRGLSYVWSLDGTAPPPGRQAPGYVTPDAGPDGLLTGKSIPTGAPPGVDYMVADESIAVQGTDILRPQVRSVITQDEFGFPIHKVVVSPAPWRLLRIDRPLRLSSTPTGIEPDGWVTPPFGASEDAPAFSAYNQFSTPGGRPGYIRIVVSRQGWQGTDKPGRVTIKVGKLVRGPDKQPALGAVSQVLHWTVHSGTTRIFYVRASPPARVELTVSPTFSPHDYGGSDRRRLGAQVAFGFVARRP
ncbi:MAG TPA: hypothetical protein VFB35_06160 [Gaiellaceae bacterium]|nr:hypothetical protein [Gaiellaceae bacterium]